MPACGRRPSCARSTVGHPGTRRIILAWSGFTWDPNRGDLLLYGGGHANYSGNDVYRWRGIDPAMGARVAAEPDQAG